MKHRALVILVLAGCTADFVEPLPPSDDGARLAGACLPMPACDAPPPDPGPRRAWRRFWSPVIAASGAPNHRGRDLFLEPGDAQWIIGKLAYGLTDKDLEGEDVDVWLNRGCGTTWEKLGTALTTRDGSPHAPVYGVPDSGGRVYFPIPAAKTLGPGRHRVRLVVAGDLTATELILDVVPAETPTFVSDVDGTLTSSENAEWLALLTDSLPSANADAAAALRALATRGYRPMYLTARPEFLVERTRQFLAQNGFPPGVVHTTTTLTGALGDAAVDYKSQELSWIAAWNGLRPAYAFGNTETDAAAYELGGIVPPENRIFYQFTDDEFGGRRVDAYGPLVTEFEALPPTCTP